MTSASGLEGDDPPRARGAAMSLAMLAVLTCSLGLAQWVSVARQPPRPPELQTQNIGTLRIDLPRKWRRQELDDPVLHRSLRDARVLAAEDGQSRLLVARLPDGTPRPPGEAMQEALSLLLNPSRAGLPMERSRVRRVRVGPAVGAACEALTDDWRRKHFLAVLSLDGRRHYLVHLTGAVHSDPRQARQTLMELSRDRIFFDVVLGSIRLTRWPAVETEAGAGPLFPLPDDRHPWRAYVDREGDGNTWLWAPTADDGVLRLVRTRWVADTTGVDPEQRLAPPHLLAERYWLTHERPPTSRELGETRLGTVVIWQVNLTGDLRQIPGLARHVWMAAIGPGRLMLLEMTGEPAGMRDTVFFARDLINAAASSQAPSAGDASSASSAVEEALALGHAIRDHQNRMLAAGPAAEEDCHVIERDGEIVGWELGRVARQHAAADGSVLLRGRSSGMLGSSLRIRGRSQGSVDGAFYDHTHVLEHLNAQGRVQQATAHRLTLKDGTLRFAVAHDGGPARLQWEMPAPRPLLSPLGADDWPVDLLGSGAARGAAIVWMRGGGSRPTAFEVRLASPDPAGEDGTRLWLRPLFGVDCFVLALDPGGRAVRYESLWEGAGGAGSQWHTTRRIDPAQLPTLLPEARQAIDQALRELEHETDFRL